MGITNTVIHDNVPTVFAVSSGAGRAGVAVIRLSGPNAGDALLALGGGTDRAREARRTRLVDPSDGTPLDDALTLWFPGPSSFTGEDVAELHVHGGRAVVDAVLGALSRIEGLEPASPGAFTRRAFDNGKLDLTEVEGLADLIAAETEAQRRQALRQMGGSLGVLYEAWRARLIRISAYVEAEIDFTDEEPDDGLAAEQRTSIANLAGEIARHLDDGRRGERLRDGFHVVLAGPPNVGKSSLLNALARRDAAIVGPEAGTTRDVIDVALDLGGYPVLVSDTAGLREVEGAVEREGIRRSRNRMGAADLVLWLCDTTDASTLAMPTDLPCQALEVWNKSDLAAAPVEDGMAVSAKTGAGLEGLINRIALEARRALDVGAEPSLTRLRHRQGLEQAVEALGHATAAPVDRPEVMAEELRIAARSLGRLTGRIDVEDLLDVIFQDFCIGK